MERNLFFETPESRLWSAAVERGQGEPHAGERQYMEVLAVRSEAGCGALRNRTARPTKKAICNILIYMDNVTQKQNV